MFVNIDSVELISNSLAFKVLNYPRVKFIQTKFIKNLKSLTEDFFCTICSGRCFLTLCNLFKLFKYYNLLILNFFNLPVENIYNIFLQTKPDDDASDPGEITTQIKVNV